jgi:RNA polymerase sigma-70 factor (ECF subfamily)
MRQDERRRRATATAPSADGADSRAWLVRLRGDSAARAEAAEDLHRFLLRATHAHLRRSAWRRELRGEELDDVAAEAADDALVAILARLDDFRGTSRFTTWAYGFALFHASLAVRKRRWKGYEFPVEGNASRLLGGSAPGPDEEVEQLELLHALREAVDKVLTDWQRQVFVEVALNGVPIEVVASRRGTTPGAAYKALHDSRRKLRRYFAGETDS